MKALWIMAGAFVGCGLVIAFAPLIERAGSVVFKRIDRFWDWQAAWLNRGKPERRGPGCKPRDPWQEPEQKRRPAPPPNRPAVRVDVSHKTDDR